MVDDEFEVLTTHLMIDDVGLDPLIGPLHGGLGLDGVELAGEAIEELLLGRFQFLHGIPDCVGENLCVIRDPSRGSGPAVVSVRSTSVRRLWSMSFLALFHQKNTRILARDASATASCG